MLRLLKLSTMDGSLPSFRLFSALVRRTLNVPSEQLAVPWHDKHLPRATSLLWITSLHTVQTTVSVMVSNELRTGRLMLKNKTAEQRTATVTCKVRTPMQVANTSNGPKWQRMSIEWFCVVCCFCCVVSGVKSVVSVLLFIGHIFYGFPRLISFKSCFCLYSDDMHTQVPAILHQPRVWSHTCLIARLWSHHKHKFPYNRKSGIINKTCW